MTDRDGRTNFTLDPGTAKMLREHLDHLERDMGFRPSSAQVVRGLIAKAIEARSAKTAGLDPKDESAVANGDLPKGSRQ